MKYKIGSWMCSTEGEYSTEGEAIKELSARYMKASKSDPPGRHPLEIFAGGTNRNIETIGKAVYLFVYTENLFGHIEWQIKYNLEIHPFKKEHWSEEFGFEECEFRYTIKK